MYIVIIKYYNNNKNEIIMYIIKCSLFLYYV